MDLNARCRNILLSAADSPETLRPSDLFRIFDEAEDQGIKKEFIRWIDKQPLNERTRNHFLVSGALVIACD